MPCAPNPVARRGVHFAQELARHGAAAALITATCQISYADLAARVDIEAKRLGDRRALVLIAGSHTIDTIVVYLAALASGHPVLLSDSTNNAAFDTLVSTYRPDVIVRTVAGHCVVDRRSRGTDRDLHPDLALLLSTSGSTGSPKLVRLSHRNVEANAESIAEYLDIQPADRAATSLPMHYCYGLSVIHSHLLRGAGLILTSDSVTAPAFWDLFRTHNGTTFAAVPYTFELLDRIGFDEFDLPHLRYITQAGGQLDPARVRRYAELGQRRGWHLVVMYGQTEATARMAYLPTEFATTRPDSIGIPIPRGSFRLDPVPGAPPDTGELIYAGPNVMLGYAHSADDLALGDVLGGELHTGDLGRVGPDGLYEVVGRLNRTAKLFGLRIDLERVESSLTAQGLVVLCADGDGELIVAVAGEVDIGDVRQSAARAAGLPLNAVRVCVADELPRTTTGKPDYAAVRALPRSPAQQWARVDIDAIRDLYARVLGHTAVTEDSSFVSLGGDSLSYVQMSLQLEELLGYMPESWHTTPIREFAPGPRRRWRTIETNVLLRAIAIILIVGSHIHLFTLAGGAHVLLGVVGYNFARFHLTPVARRTRIRGVLVSVTKVAVPSVLWIGALVLFTGDYHLRTALLLNGILGPSRWNVDWRYWFVEAVVYIVLAVLALLCIPILDRTERRFPFGFAVALVGFGLLLRYGVIGNNDDINRVLSAPVVLWLFALGWAAARSTNAWQRLGVTAAVLVTTPGFFSGDTRRELVLIGGLCLLVWIREVPCPTVLSRTAGILASASLYIYLTHYQVYLPLRGHAPLWLAFGLSITVGIVYWQGITFVERRRPRLRGPRSTPAHPVPVRSR